MVKVLIVEDDILIADMVEERLTADGFNVCGIATNIAEGLSIADKTQPDVAVVDVRLADGDLGTTLAVELKRRYHTGILYATGNVELVSSDAVGEGYLRKPYRLADLARAIQIVQDISFSGVSSVPKPEGLILIPKPPIDKP